MTARTGKAPATPSVEEAEQEAREADALVDALEERVREGDATLSADQITAQRSVAEFARLRADAARRKATAQKEADRIAACERLAAEIQATNTADMNRLTEALDTIESLADEFASALNTHNAKLGAWRDLMVSLGVKMGQGYTAALDPAAHGGLGLSELGGRVHVHGTTLNPVDPAIFLGFALGPASITARKAIASQYTPETRASEHLVRSIGG